MSPTQLQTYLHEQIPLSRAMCVEVLESGAAGVVLTAPLAPNINHRATVFGGSAAALATLAAWSVLHIALAGQARLVIQEQTMRFERPITGGFAARSHLEDDDAWARFRRTLTRRGRARLTLPAVLEQDAMVVGQFTGEFVALHGH